MPTRDSFLDALSFLDAPAKPAAPAPVAPLQLDARKILQRELEAARAENERLHAARAKPAAPAPVAPIEPRPVSGRPDFADAIDAMVVDMVASGAVYLDGDTYRTRKRAWKYAD